MLKEVWIQSRMVCSPPDFVFRQQKLLEEIGKYLLMPLFVIEENERIAKEQGEE